MLNVLKGGKQLQVGIGDKRAEEIKLQVSSGLCSSVTASKRRGKNSQGF